ncbi:hypothetical protein [Paracoccus sp. ME4]
MQNKTSRLDDLTNAFRAAIEEIGMDTFKQCSFFGSAACHKEPAR